MHTNSDSEHGVLLRVTRFVVLNLHFRVAINKACFKFKNTYKLPILYHILYGNTASKIFGILFLETICPHRKNKENK